jgi:group I intron endonuclease
MGYAVNRNSISGIYGIRNVINNKIYIGSSKNIAYRWTDHKRCLNTNCHPNRHLQYAWNKYGANNFEHFVVEICSIDVLMIRENVWIQYYDSMNKNKGYNAIDAQGYVRTEETLKNMSEAQQKYALEHPEVVEKRIKHLADINKNRIYKTGYMLPEKHCKNLSLSKIGNKNHLGILNSEECRRKISMANKGRVQSPEEKQKRREIKLKYYADKRLVEASNGNIS